MTLFLQTKNQQSTLDQPTQQFYMNSSGRFPPNSASGYTPQPPMYHQQPSAPPPPSPPPYSTENPYNQSSTSSGLYPKFN